MDEQKHTEESELDLDTSEDEVADTSATDTGEQETESSSEQEQDTLNLEDSKGESQEKGKAQSARDKMVADWTKKIESGAKTLDDIPKDQSWLRPLIEAQGKPNLDKTIETKLAQREQQKEFQALKGELLDMGLEREKRLTIEQEYKEFRAEGMSELKALKAACKVAGVDPKESALDAQRHAMRLRVPGNYSKADGYDPSNLHDQAGYAEVAKNVPADKRFEYLKKLANS